MSSRDHILGAIRATKPAPRELPDVPLFDANRAANLEGRFFAAFTAMGGTTLDRSGSDPLASVRARIANAGVVVSMVPEIVGNRILCLQPLEQMETTPIPDPSPQGGRETKAGMVSPASLADVDIAIVRAAFAIAETGSIALTERELGVNTLGYLAQHLIVLLDPADILVNLHHAYQRPEFQTARYCVFHTGPSATADIEGVLIHGAQGVRSLSILLLSRPS